MGHCVFNFFYCSWNGCGKVLASAGCHENIVFDAQPNTPFAHINAGIHGKHHIFRHRFFVPSYNTLRISSFMVSPSGEG